MPQTVTVKAVNDGDREGTHFSRLTHTVSQTGGYSGVLANSIDFTVIDNDVAGVLITQSKGSTSVTEETTEVPVGGGQVTTDVTGDRKTVTGTFGSGVSGGSVLPEVSDNDWYWNAQDIDLVNGVSTTIPRLPRRPRFRT